MTGALGGADASAIRRELDITMPQTPEQWLAGGRIGVRESRRVVDAQSAGGTVGLPSLGVSATG